MRQRQRQLQDGATGLWRCRFPLLTELCTAGICVAMLCTLGASGAVAQHASTGHAAEASQSGLVTHHFATPYDGSFDDATFAVENAIVGRGLVVDHISHVGEMLARTRADVGSDQVLFEAADMFLFCSAVVSRRVMEADPMNIAHCPYGIFVVEQQGEVMIGHRRYPPGAMQQVQTLLAELVAEAIDG